MSILEVSNVSKSFGGVKANVDISMNVEKGKIVGLIGPNGSGKTTLVNSIVGSYQIDNVTMNFNDKEYARKVAFIEFLYEKNKKFVLTHSDEALIDLIFLLYKSFEIGEADKKIIQKNN